MKTTNTISYSGSVKVSLVGPNNKVLLQKESHNSGKFPLFEFLGYCLVGNYYSELRPCRIRLFTKGRTETPANPSFDTDTCVSEAVLHEPGTVMNKVKTDEACQVTYHFKIPYAFIKLDMESENAVVYKLALYSNTNSSDSELNIKNPSATYLFTDSTGTSWVDKKDAIDLSELQSNYSIIVDWTMTIKDGN